MIDHSDEQLVLMRRAAFGRMVEEFFNTDIGKYISGRIEEEMKVGYKGLRDCDPETVKEVRKFQNMVWRAESIKEWFNDALIDGFQALNILEEENGC